MDRPPPPSPPTYDSAGGAAGGNGRQRRSSLGGFTSNQSQQNLINHPLANSASGIFMIQQQQYQQQQISSNNNLPSMPAIPLEHQGSNNFVYNRSQSANNSYASPNQGLGLMAAQALSDDRFLCPITGQLMRDPVRTPCGHNFDRKSIPNQQDEQDYIESEITCPVCFSVFPRTQLRSDVQLSQEMARIMASIPSLPQPGNSSQSQLQLDMRSVSPALPATAAASKSKNSSPTSKKSLMGIFQRRKSIAEPPSDQPIEESPVEASNPAPRASSRRGSFLSRFRPKGPYAKIVFLSDLSQGVDFLKEEYVIGRSSQCDVRFKQVEVSGRHCRIFKVEAGSAGNPEIQCFMEDYSTNGTYVNGTKIPKDTPTMLNHLDEISLGRKFTSADYPLLPQFIDMTFYGLQPGTLKYNLIQSLKTSVPSFSKLLAATDSDLQHKYGINNSDVRLLVLKGIKNWSNTVAVATFRFEYAHDPRTDDSLPNYATTGRRASLQVENLNIRPPAAVVPNRDPDQGRIVINDSNPALNVPAGLSPAVSPGRRGSFFRGATEISFAEPNCYAKVHDGKIEVEVVRKAIKLDEPAKLKMICEDENILPACFMTKFPQMLDILPGKDRLKLAIEWKKEEMSNTRQVYHFTLKVQDESEAEIYTFKRHKLTLTLESGESWIAARHQQKSQIGPTLPVNVIDGSTAAAAKTPNEAIPPNNTANNNIPSARGMVNGSSNARASFLGENRGALANVIIPVMDLSDLALRLLSYQFLDLDQLVIKKVLADIAREWERSCPETPLELHIWVGLAHLTLLDFKFFQFKAFAGKTFLKSTESEEKQFSRFMRTDLSDYLVPREAAFYFCVSITNSILVNYQKSQNVITVPLDVSTERVALAYVNNRFKTLEIPFKSMGNVECTGKGSLVDVMRSRFDVNFVNELIEDPKMMKPDKELLHFDVYSASRPNIFQSKSIHRVINQSNVGADGNGNLTILIESANDAVLVDVIANTLPQIIFQQAIENEITVESRKDSIYEILRESLIYADNIVGAVTSNQMGGNTGASVLITFVQPKRIILGWVGSCKASILRCNSYSSGTEDHGITFEPILAVGSSTHPHLSTDKGEMLRLKETFGPIAKSRPDIFLPAYPPVSRSLGFLSFRPILSPEPEFLSLEVDQVIREPILIVLGTLGFWEPNIFETNLQGIAEGQEVENRSSMVADGGASNGSDTTVSMANLCSWIGSFYGGKTTSLTSQLPSHLISKVTEIYPSSIYQDIGVVVSGITPTFDQISINSNGIVVDQ